MNVSGKHVLVIGAKRSGLAAIELLRKHGAQVRAMDAQPSNVRLDIPVVPQSEDNIRDAGRDPDMIVLSPGVPYDEPLLIRPRERGVPVIGEVELAAYFLKGPVIGITGSNGKTTTTALTGHVLEKCGVACQVGGNIGTAVTSMIDSSREGQWNVLELSSFQLESIRHFRAEIAACLNVTPNHLNRHHTFENYVAAKARLFETQHAGDRAVLNYDDPVCVSFAPRTQADVFWFSALQRVPTGVWLDGEELCFDDRPFMRQSQIRLRGRHNVENAMAAALISSLAGANLDQIGPAVESFSGVEHRIEFVRELDGVEYFNDSKATSVDAALKAIEAFAGGLWIVLGGEHKGSPYTPLREPLHKRARAALVIGDKNYPQAAAPFIRKDLAGAVDLVDCGTLDRAVHYARTHAAPGDTVLLAPACASFDQFENFEQRGKVFKQIVTELF
ncbi:MAG TPA: UDP-N-acetylmuramoyl-L-alanine--D-glutamate ligase [Steroidobacteraceae bacterium]|nr:UDP-N-acetylmuramoyl-L-alanine--D-glutamate ligase [Steroidobacteraceae bacterium]